MSNLRITSDFLYSFFLFSLTSLISSCQVLAEETEGFSQYTELGVQPGALLKTVPAEEAGIYWDGFRIALTVVPG